MVGQNVTLRSTGLCPSLSFSEVETVQSERVESWIVILLILAYGFIIALLSFFVRMYRRKVYSGVETIDTAFTGGGQMNAGFVTTNLVSQWTWTATLLQSSGVGIKYGISGPFWYAAGACIQMIIFSCVSVMLKIRAPGAITFLQVIRARFGRPAHITFCVFALLTNLIVTSMLMLGGCAVLVRLTENLSLELCALLIVLVIGIYTMTGDLASQYYISYLTTATLLLAIIAYTFAFFHQGARGRLGVDLSSLKRIYDLLNCRLSRNANVDESYLTLLSPDGLMFGIINVIGNFGTIFVDQSYWSASVATKPREGVVGFVCGAVVWFAIPFTFATTSSLFYLSYGVLLGHDPLSEYDVDSGLAPEVAASYLFGKAGQIVLITMVVIAVTTTASAEVFAVTSILVYDVYAVYWRPFRRTFDANACILCGKMRGRLARLKDKCKCISMGACQACSRDDRENAVAKRKVQTEFKCGMHGTYRSFLQYLMGLKNWCMIYTILSILPITLALQAMQIQLGWLYSFMGVLVGSAVCPVSYVMFVERLTGLAIILGAVLGTLLALIAWIVHAALSAGGVANLWQNTGLVEVMLTGNCVSIGLGALIPLVVSFIMNWRQSSDREEIWENTRDLDNPLRPWAEVYAEELQLKNANELSGGRPTLDLVQMRFRLWIILAASSSVVLTLVYVVLWPGVAASLQVFTFGQFEAWILVMEAYIIVVTLCSLVGPIVSEFLKARKASQVRMSIGPRITDVDTYSPAGEACKTSQLPNQEEAGTSMQRIKELDE